ncbi:hypothetical protein DPEC_G00247530 [Dallia pectoralis]|uniref:Uncharacterized protein n=1 Tax=Dallia pectoralis TaxID=75939 RepID=A0ACC2FWJ4_DALPE|nr:hypothetical protein DPEC_G00247530 [Dallia pectoralis]
MDIHNLSGNHHLNVVERFVCPYEPEGWVVWSFMLLVGFPKASGLRRGARQRMVHQDPMKDRGKRSETLPGGSPGPPSGARPRRRARKRASGGRVCQGARPGTARTRYVASLSSSSCGPTTHRNNRRGRVRCHMGGSEGVGSRRIRPGRQKLALGTGTSPRCGGRSQNLCVRWSDTSWIWWDLPLHTTVALEPYSWIGVGLCSSLELPRVRGGGLVWGYSRAHV